MSVQRERWTSSQDSRRAPTRMLGYVSVGVEETEHLSGAFQRQVEQIATACEQRGLSLVHSVREREPARGSALRRPGLGYALEQLEAGEADGLVVAELRRLTYSLAELGRILEAFVHSNARFIVAGLHLDTAEEAGRLTVNMIVSMARSEHERLVARTRKGMLAAQGRGLPRVADNPALQQRIARMRADGMTLMAIAEQLNAEHVPTIRGGAMWRPSSVQVAAGYHRPSPDDWRPR